MTVTGQQGKAPTLSAGNGITVTPGENNTFTFVMPGKEVALSLSFIERAFSVVLDSDTADNEKYLSLGDTRYNKGDKVIISLTQAGLSAGKNFALTAEVYTALGVLDDTITIIVTRAGNQFTFVMPEDMVENETVRVGINNVASADKGLAVTVTPSINGTVSAAAHVDLGETLEIKVTPSAGYKLKADSLKISFKQPSLSTEATFTITADSAGKYLYQLGSGYGSDDVQITLSAEFVKDANGSAGSLGKKTFSAGVGLTVAITQHRNNAEFRSGTITTGSLSVTATSGSDAKKITSSATAKAGYSQGNFGVAGAIAVNVASAYTGAFVRAQGTALRLSGGSLAVKAESYERFVTAAESINASGASGTNLGVGAGLATAVCSADTIARVEDGTSFRQTGSLSTVEVSANHSGEETLSAKAGSAGGVSVTPVLGLIVSGAYTNALLGKLSSPLTIAGDLLVSSQSAVTREVAANAAAAGGSVGMGGSFAVTVLNDSSTATLKANATARNVKVNAVSRSTLKSTSRAGSQGASSGSGSSGDSGSGSDGSSGGGKSEADQQADHSIAGGVKLAGTTGGANTGSGALTSLTANRQTAQTSEGNVQIAAAFVLNVQQNRSEALIDGGVAIIAKKNGSDTGKVAVTSYNNTDATVIANASATKAKIGVGVAAALNIVSFDNLAHIDAASITAEDLTVTARMYSELKKAVTTVAGTGEDINIIDTLVTKALTELLDELEKVMGLSKLFGIDDWQNSTIRTELLKIIPDLAAKAVATMLDGTGLAGLISTDIGEKLNIRLSTLGTTVTDSVKKNVTDAILGMVLSKVQSALSSEKAITNKPAAGQLTPGSQLEKMATNIANEVFAELIDATALKTFFRGDMAATLKNNAINMLKQSGKALTTNALDALSGWMKLKVKPSQSTPTHNFVTEAIAGAGATNVGVAGSVAIAVINGNTKAYLGKVEANSQYPIQITGDASIEAVCNQNEETVASAAVGSDGGADRNLAGGGDSDTGDGSSAGTHYDEKKYSNKLVSGSTTNGKIANVTESQSQYTITVTPDVGYKAKIVTLTRSDTGATVDAKQNSDGTWSYAFAASSKLATDAVITVVALFEADSKEVKTHSTGNGTVSVGTPSGSTTTTAKYEDRLLDTVNPAAGYTLDTLKFTFTAPDGSIKTYNIVTKENPTGNSYSFYMPETKDFVTVNATFRALATGETQLVNPNPSTTASGSSVGVGAAFALNVVNMTVEATVGENRSVLTGTMDLRAEGRNEATAISVAGTDPLSGEDNTGTGGNTASGTTTKDISVDASIAVSILHNNIRAAFEKGTQLTTTAGNTHDVGTFDEGTYESGLKRSDYASDESYASAKAAALAKAKEAAKDLLSFYLYAGGHGSSLAKASSFAIGGKAAVGAAVAINLANTDAAATFSGTGRITGTARLTTTLYNADDAYGIATAMGADMERYLSSFRTGTQSVQDGINKVAQGTWSESDLRGTNTNNQTAGKLNGELNQNKGDGGKNANNNLPLSTNVLKGQNVKTEGTPDSATTEAQKQATASGSGATSQQAKTQGNSIQVAAAIALNITNHKATTTLEGSLTAGALQMLSDNSGNFRTTGTGASVTLAKSDASVAAGVAVSVNHNEATTTVSGTVTTDRSGGSTGEITIEADMKQNLDGDYKGSLASQAIAGAVTGAGSKATVSGAVAIVISRAKATAEIKADSVISAMGALKLSANDKSKLGLRAGALSVSTGTSVGVGASFALIYAENEVHALIGDRAKITGTSITVEATKQRIDWNDYSTGVGLDTLVTDSTNAVPEKKGIIDIKKDIDNNSYSVSINISTDTILDAVKLLNFLSFTNYYAEAIAGAISGGATGNASVAGSFAMAFFRNVVQAALGTDVTLKATEGDITVFAHSDTNARLIAGALSVSPAKAGVGLTVGSIAGEDRVEALSGDGVKMTSAGKITHAASVKADYLAVTVAASIATSSSGNGVGGAINVITMQNTVLSTLGKNTVLQAAGDIAVTADAAATLMLISLSAAGAGGQAAVGGTLATVITENSIKASVGKNANLISTMGSITVSAHSSEDLVSALASASAAPTGNAVAGTLCVHVAKTLAGAYIGDDVTLKAQKNVNILSDSTDRMITIAMALSGGSRLAIGATVSVNVFLRTVETLVGAGSTLHAVTGSILTDANANDWTLALTLAAGASGNNAFAGTIPVIVSKSTVRTVIGYVSADSTALSAAHHNTLTAGDSIGVLANLDTHNYIVSGGLAASGTTAVGATLSTAVYHNTILAEIHDWAVLTCGGSATGTGIALHNRQDKRRGVIVSATGTEDILMISIGAGAAGTNAVSGVINTLVVENIIHSQLMDHVLVTAAGTSGYTITETNESDGTSRDVALSSGDVLITASDDAFLLNLAGSLSAAGNIGVGATVVVLTFTRDLIASTGVAGSITAGGSVTVSASVKDDLMLLAVALGASGNVGVAGGANALVFRNKTLAALGGKLLAHGNVIVTAEAASKLYNIAAGVGAGGSVGVTAVAVVTYFTNETKAFVRTGAVLGTAADPIGGSVTIKADSREFLTADAAGVSGGGTAGVGGTLDVIVTKVKTEAYTEANVEIRALGAISILGNDRYELYAVVVSAAISRTAAVGVTALVSVSYNTVSAVVGKNNTLLGKSVTVKAASNRDVLSVVSTVAGSGVAGVGVSLSVIITGNKMSQDAHDTLYPGADQQMTVTSDKKTYLVYSQALENGNTINVYEQQGKAGVYYTAVTNADGSLTMSSYSVNAAKLTKVSASAIDPQKQLESAFQQGNSAALAHKPGEEESLDLLLAGDGQHTGDKDYGSYGQDTNTTKPNTTPVNDTNGSASWDDSTYHQTAEGTKYTPAPLTGLSDATSAVIGNGSHITATGGDINVLASDVLSANMISGTVAVSGTAGVGVGLSVSTLASNVQALSEDNAVLSATGNINIKASAGSESKATDRTDAASGDDVDKKYNNYASSVNQKAETDGVSAVTSTIRLISVTAGGGLVGVGVSGAVLLVFSEARAILAADITGAKNVTVASDMNFGTVFTVNVGVSGGAVAVNVSVGSTTFQGNVETAIAGNASLYGVTGKITVQTNGVTNATTAAATVAGGAVAVNAGVALAINRTTVNTYIGKGVIIGDNNLRPDILVNTTFTTNAAARILSVTGGAIAVGASVTIAINHLDARTYIGSTPLKAGEAAKEGSASAQSGKLTAKNVTVSSNVTGTTDVTGIGVAGGAIAVNGIVALGFNTITNYAAVNRINLDASSLLVSAALTGDVTVLTTAITGGWIAAGATVAVADVNSDNKALIDTTGCTLKVTATSIHAGTAEKPNSSQALVGSISGTAGTLAAALNIGVAINEGANRAIITGESGSLTGGSLTVEAYGNGRAYAVMANAGFGQLTANVTLAFAWLKNTQEALVEGKTDINLSGSLTVRSRQMTSQSDFRAFGLSFGKVNSDGKNAERAPYTLSISFNKMAQAYIFSAAAGFGALSANSATALANATSRAKVSAAKLTINGVGDITVTNDAESTAAANIDSLSIGVISVGLMVGYAYAEGTFEAALESSGVITARNLSVINTYSSHAESVVNPALGGVDAGWLDADANIAIARVLTVATAHISGTGTIEARGSVTVKTIGTATVEATVVGAIISAGKVKLTANVAVALLGVKQDAYIGNIEGTAAGTAAVSLRATGNIMVLSLFNEDSEHEKGAAATIGSNGVTTGVEVSYLNVKVSSATAEMKTAAKAYILGGTVETDGVLEIAVNAHSYANADISVPEISLGVLGVTLLATYAHAKGTFAAYCDAKNIKAGSLSITDTYYAKATAATGPAGGVGVSLATTDSNIAIADTSTVASAALYGNGTLTVSGSATVKTTGYVLAQATGRTRDFSASAFAIAVNVIKA